MGPTFKRGDLAVRNRPSLHTLELTGSFFKDCSSQQQNAVIGFNLWGYEWSCTVCLVMFFQIFHVLIVLHKPFSAT